jgi:hypothetical protein
MGTRNDKTFVYYDTNITTNISQYRYKVSPNVIYMDVLKQFTDRYVYVANLDGLLPSTQYYFTIVSDNNIIDKFSYRTFMTGPADERPFNFIVGGDLGMDPGYETILQQSSFTSPLFALLGGDVTYENGIPACYLRWDRWLDTWESIMVTPSGLTIPIISAIGNHEAGGINKRVADVPFFRSYLVHEKIPTGQSPNDLKSYREHYLGSKAGILCLDSYINEKPHDQRDWMTGKFDKFVSENRTNIFAIYHVGLYPSKRDPKAEPHLTLRNVWEPIFDKYLKIGFENHDHLYKRTHLMRNGEVSKNNSGVLYIGDGAFGVSDAKKGTPYDYIAKIESKLFFFNVLLDNNNVSISAIDSKGEIFDQFKL